MAATIQPRPNGPYLVREVTQLRNAEGEAISHEAVFALCRCGGSAHKPFCDGTHKTNGFSDARLADPSKDKVRSYPGPGITIHDNRSICAHAGACTDGLAAVFKYGEKPWIDACGAAAAAIAETIRRCPSGALSYTLEGEAPVPAPGRPRVGGDPIAGGPPRITVTKDGPYVVAGECELLEAAWAEGASRVRYTLCRCGASKNKPFCDGSHFDAGFKDG
ncbi:MAG: CDGSH iron-sulfur domain-containing protein [Usitatibacter sp.]